MEQEESESVSLTLDKEQLLQILKRAASKDRTVIEFRTQETQEGQRELHRAMDITEHVEELEDDLDVQQPA